MSVTPFGLHVICKTKPVISFPSFDSSAVAAYPDATLMGFHYQPLYGMHFQRVALPLS